MPCMEYQTPTNTPTTTNIEIILKTRHQNKSGVKGRVDKALNAILGAPDKTRLSDLKKLRKWDMFHGLRRANFEEKRSLWDAAATLIDSPDKAAHEAQTRKYNSLKHAEKDYSKNVSEYARIIGRIATEGYEDWVASKDLMSLWLSRYFPAQKP